VLWLRLEIGVGHAEAMIIAKLQQALPILVYLANSKGTQAVRPRVMVCTYSGFEVAREDEVFTTVDVLDGVTDLSPQLLLIKLHLNTHTHVYLLCYGIKRKCLAENVTFTIILALHDSG